MEILKLYVKKTKYNVEKVLTLLLGFTFKAVGQKLLKDTSLWSSLTDNQCGFSND